jgi:hypothetical protein
MDDAYSAFDPIAAWSVGSLYSAIAEGQPTVHTSHGRPRRNDSSRVHFLTRLVTPSAATTAPSVDLTSSANR